uniref:Uncharacterized protein n=1 Tax=Oryza brachyantha TaxID=4533 RepID=J3KVE6_ORYBR
MEILYWSSEGTPAGSPEGSAGSGMRSNFSREMSAGSGARAERPRQRKSIGRPASTSRATSLQGAISAAAVDGFQACAGTPSRSSETRNGNGRAVAIANRDQGRRMSWWETAGIGECASARSLSLELEKTKMKWSSGEECTENLQTGMWSAADMAEATAAGDSAKSRPATRAKRARRNWPSSSSICSERSTTHQGTGGTGGKAGDGCTGNGATWPSGVTRPRGGGDGVVAAVGEPSGVEASPADVVASEGVRREATRRRMAIESEEDPGLRGRLQSRATWCRPRHRRQRTGRRQEATR